MTMVQAFDSNSQTYLPYPEDFRPSVDELERQILTAWSELCASVRSDGAAVHAILAAQLHDRGVLRFQALQRKGVAA